MFIIEREIPGIGGTRDERRDGARAEW